MRKYVHMHWSNCPLKFLYVCSICLSIIIYLSPSLSGHPALRQIYLNLSVYPFNSCGSSLSPRKSSSQLPFIRFAPPRCLGDLIEPSLPLQAQPYVCHGAMASRLGFPAEPTPWIKVEFIPWKWSNWKIPTAESHHTQLIVLGGFHDRAQGERGRWKDPQWCRRISELTWPDNWPFPRITKSRLDFHTSSPDPHTFHKSYK